MTGGKITVGDESLRGALAQVQVLNRAVAYDEVHTAYGVRLTAVTPHNGRNFAAAVEIGLPQSHWL